VRKQYTKKNTLVKLTIKWALALIAIFFADRVTHDKALWINVTSSAVAVWVVFIAVDYVEKKLENAKKKS